MITPSFSLTATERVLPRLALDFTTASLDPRVTFTRSGATATRVNSSGGGNSTTVTSGSAGAGGGALAYANNIAVTPGASYTVVIPALNSGGATYFKDTATVAAGL
jgi:hypothetical protein